jgi:hypothetical protein
MGLETQSEECEMKIIGAGLSGLLAGALIPGSKIYERQTSLPNNHGAILRFRSDKISKALNIPFRKVRVTKAIWSEVMYGFAEPTPRIKNMYSKKVTGVYGQRSIDDIVPCYRYIAPDDFITQLAERCEILFAREFPSDVPAGGPVISTIPLPVMMSSMGMKHTDVNFNRQPIWSSIYEFDDVDLYQTIYFPDPNTYVYRASFTGNKLIVESVANPRNVGDAVDMVLNAFGVEANWVSSEVKNEKYGKIIEIDAHIRHSIIQQLSMKNNIYSLGRYATWRNILLDDVFEDIHRIKALSQKDSYLRRLS